MRFLRRPVPSAIAAVVLTAVVACALDATAQDLVATPVLPAYGEAITIDLKNTSWPMYLPATRYRRTGSLIEIEYEYVTDGFGPGRADFGLATLQLGELPPGNYQVHARLRNIDTPSASPIELATQIAMVPPQQWGIYAMPQAPQAFSAAYAVIRSAAYFYPSLSQASLSGNVVRVDFEYRSDAPASGQPPAGMSTFGATRMPELAPGAYRLEGWGRADMEGDYEKFFTREFSVAPTVPVVEFYSGILDHYFMAAGGDEIDLLDIGGQGDWRRTGQQFSAWLRQGDAPANAVPVCRFYASGPNSHFYTGSSQECGYLRTLEQQQRAEASARGQPFLGWAYEAIAFWALVPQAGLCPGGSKPVYRTYNDRAAQIDSNHRFMADATQYNAMLSSWADEGVQLCGAS
jgi:hypothetical protein